MQPNPAPPQASRLQLQGIFTQVYRTILTGQAELPSLPRVAVRLNQVLRDRNYTVEHIVPIVQSDPAAAAYLLRISNSPLYRRRLPVNDLHTAINRFGATTTRNLLLTYSTRSVFQNCGSLFGRLLERIWQDSMRVGATAGVIARQLLPEATDAALLAGLLHAIGALPLIQHLQSRGFGEADIERTLAALERYGPTVGAALLEHWQFDEELKKAVRQSDDWSHCSRGPLDLTDIVLLARLHALIATGQAASAPRLIDLPLFAKLPAHALTPGRSLAIIEQAQDDIQDVMALLGG
jgi:HD-like signal output (HDOD) protein